ncbi:hypothetical protein SAMN05421595_2899 [Austwickia chelonae]|uniref:EamA domain-containing protein n=1 Tax=Austwickia chelonae NBRC 105200 TaxID=1184607 RepID=K6VQP8_9MICO|nr:hypothetical protein [Austwickia chelonae]GAB79039.1 hypothetical protein AUCHE_18_00400 [Austwickia chelonae NBRC 105200]SEW41795.1 hypothetical protein SAMN05421595_2899 [Austwickia chelonae]
MAVGLALLFCGVLAYGFAGVLLTSGSQVSKGPLRSRSWWAGTTLQGVGFLVTFASRHELPLLLVQASIVASLGVTATVQQWRGVIRLTSGDSLAIGGVVAGLAGLSLSSRTGTVAPVGWTALLCVAAVLAVTTAATVHAFPGATAGILSGLSFGAGAIAARFVAAQPDRWVGTTLRWSWTDLIWLVLIGIAMVSGQAHVTQGLSREHPVTVLGCMHIAGTVFPALTGAFIAGERPREGFVLLMLCSVAVVALCAYRLLRLKSTPSAVDIPSPRTSE